MLVALDLGNTSLGVGAFDDGGRLVAEERLAGGCAVADGFLLPPHVAAADEVVVGASAPAQVPALLAAIARPARVLDAAVAARVPTTYVRPVELGIDRLAAAFGAREIAAPLPAPGEHGAASRSADMGVHPEAGVVVVVDAGTAITVDAIDARGRFVAVAIAPGLAAASDGLARAAPHLPRPRLSSGTAELPATGTDASLRNGALLGAAGLIERLVHEARTLVGGAQAPVVLTGGAAERLGPLLPDAWTRAPSCVLRGLRALHLALPEESAP